MRRKKNVHRRLRLTLLINQGKKKTRNNTKEYSKQHSKKGNSTRETSRKIKKKKVNTTSSKDYTHKKDVGYTRKIIKSFSPFLLVYFIKLVWFLH